MCTTNIWEEDRGEKVTSQRGAKPQLSFPEELMYAYKQSDTGSGENILSAGAWSDPTAFYCELHFSRLLDFKMASDSLKRGTIKIFIQSMLTLPRFFSPATHRDITYLFYSIKDW